MEETIRLFELNQYIQQVIELNFGSDLWVSCEFSNMKYSRGHYYVDLVDKDDYSDKIISKMQAVIWKTNVQYIEDTRNLSLQDLAGTGLEVRVKVHVEFHPIYGLKLMITDLDPNYTIGKLELRRKETLQQLKQEGLMDLNKELHLPEVVQNIAVISSENAAGYKDFINELANNSFGYSYKIKLFQAALQGDSQVAEFLKAISTIEGSGPFDALIIIRGGGSKLDLAGYDEYELAKKIALCKIPVLTGIGHEIDLSITDLVGYRNFKTPTAVAGFLIERSLFFENKLAQILNEIKEGSLQIVKSKELDLHSIHQSIKALANMNLESYRYQWKEILEKTYIRANHIIDTRKNALDNLIQSIRLSSPEAILKLGYALIEQNNERKQSIKAINKKESLAIRMADGKLEVKTVSDNG